MKIYTIIGGVNGVGKSSLTGVLAAESNDLGVIIDTDKITAALGGDRIRGGKEAIKRINNSLKMGINLTQETTLSGSRTLIILYVFIISGLILLMKALNV